jgi:serine protease Do
MDSKALKKILIVIIFFFLTACDFKANHTVSFFYENQLIETQIVFLNQKIKPIEAPKREGYLFVYWTYIDKHNIVKPFDINTKIRNNTVLTALYLYDSDLGIDFKQIINEIEMSYITATVGVSVRFLSGYTQLSTSLGSGVIFCEDVNCYYALTNYHVIDYENKETVYNYHCEISVINIYGAKLPALLMCESFEYDLAIVKFEKKNVELKIIELALNNPDEGITVFSIGFPKGQANTLTIGNVKDYKKVNVINSGVKFEVLCHDAPISYGSSGGAIIDLNYCLIGLNFAGYKDIETDMVVSSYAIPILKIKEFLTANGY